MVLALHVVTIGHETVMAKTTFFGGSRVSPDAKPFDYSHDYYYQEELQAQQSTAPDQVSRKCIII